MRSSPRRRDDDDVIRARLRALLAEGPRAPGWVPEDNEPPADEPREDEPPEDEAQDDRVEGGTDDGADDEGSDGEGSDGEGSDGEGMSHAGHFTRHAGPHSAELPGGLGRHRAPGRTARVDPGRPGAWALWAAAVLAAVGVLGWTWLGRPAVDRVPATASTSTAAPTAAAPPTEGPAPDGSAATPDAGSGGTVVVSVVGQVARPGLVTLPAGSRVADALGAAGGLLPEADPASVNAAALLADGQQIAVGVPGAAAPANGSAAPTGSGALLDLNTATVADLDGLPGIGPVLAQRIIDHRTAHGPFTSVDQLDEVSGIGPAIFADLAGRVRV